MNKQIGTILLSIFLIGMGVLVLLSNLNLLPFDFHNNQIFWMLVFGIVGLGFLLHYLTGIQTNWWAVIPGLTLLGLAMLVGMPLFWSNLGGALFLGMIGLSFLIIFVTGRTERWWAIIPGGVMLTLTAIVMLSETPGSNMLIPAVLFFGLSATFMVVYLVMQLKWALWPAGILALVGVLATLGTTGAMALVFPAALIAIGGYLVIRSARPRLQ